VIWNSASEFFAMGGYGLYVWGSFGVTAVVIAAEIWLVAARRKAIGHLVADVGPDESKDAP
jgi:heme exporter protein D